MADHQHISADELQRFVKIKQSIHDAMENVFIGESAIVDKLLVALVAKGHVLIEGVPGIAKTTLVKTFATCLGCDFKRVQFTPDLLPSDITGTHILDFKSNDFTFRPGPIFTHILLGDEINRAPAKTQSALLEAMQEGQATIDGKTLSLPHPFIVMATQNPFEQDGTYPLPEAQIDRFLIKINLSYPSYQHEKKMLALHNTPTPEPTALLSPEDIRHLQHQSQLIHVSEDLMDYMVKLTRYTRTHPHVLLGASPRATLGLLNATKAHALLQGRAFALPDDTKAVAESVLIHRIIVSENEFSTTQAHSETVVQEALRNVLYTPAPDPQ